MLLEFVSQRYERACGVITSNPPFDDGTKTFGTEQLIGAPLDRLTHHVHIQAGSARIRMAGQSLEQDEGLQREIPK